ncbi:MAG: GNAT family N-acetyltransferase [Deltaproteobacteria bacterium]|nr:GNAT family N-acetyltransferase [Deltaproteobacteria bacterium]
MSALHDVKKQTKGASDERTRKQWRLEAKDLVNNVELIALLDEKDSEVASFAGGRAVFHRKMQIGFLKWAPGSLCKTLPSEITCWLSHEELDESALFLALSAQSSCEKMSVLSRPPTPSLFEGLASGIFPLAEEHDVPTHLSDEARWCLTTKRPAFVALFENHVVAFAYVPWISPNHFDISVECFAEFRCQGWGRKVVQALIHDEKVRKKTAVWGALKSNAASLALARSLGFQKDVLNPDGPKELWIAQQKTD